ncbi:DUF1292 domain-containing protein [Dellaglioa sp. P0083]|uniref:DUF1292 domain-containing protein n=1 Tax=Dellaglioa kimchii TaxID=3344667 RepID=UPI0038D3AEB6
MNNEEENQQITLVDDNGNETLFEVLFTFESDDYNKSYIMLYPLGSEADEEVEIQAYSFSPNENGEATESDLEPIEDDDEWDMVEEVLNTFLSDESMQ